MFKMKVAALVAVIILPCRLSAAWAEAPVVDGEYGKLQVHGRLFAGSCQLDMRSAFQQIEMGETSTALLSKTGDEGQPVTFTLQLRDCQGRGGQQTDIPTGTVSQDWRQPVISVSFVAPADPDMPRLLMTKGVSGVALKLEDGQGRQVIPGMPGRPQFVTPQQDRLVYKVTPVRTPAPLTTGVYQAVANFRINYD